ncbi:MAG: acyl carrier protein [Lachnospiraceae bacterium]|nr:acyl carrier protein [Lachnospiraceae bacterium]
MDNAAAKIISMIQTIFGNISVTPDSRIKEIGFSSFTFVKFSVSLEEAFKIEFEIEYLNYEKFVFVNDLVTYVEKRQQVLA